MTTAQATVTPRDAWSAARLPVVVGAVVVIVGATLALLQGGVRGGLLDPEGARSGGGQALAVLLAQRDVDVVRVAAPSRSGDTTTFVPVAALLGSDVDITALLPSRGRDVVLVAPGEDLIAAVARAGGFELRVTGEADVGVRRPRCSLVAAQTAGRAHVGGELYRAARAGQCYPADGGHSLVVLTHDGGELRVVGSADLFANSELDEQGNAALALGLLSGRPKVEWVYPRADERAALGSFRRSLVDLLPDRVVLAGIQLGLAAVWLALWRARRLGPVVVEALPVVVRAAETVEGRAGLYRTARARDTAAQSLRSATRRRLSSSLGLGVAPGRGSLQAAVAARSGRDTAAVDDLLYGRTPADDAALVRLARDLDVLDHEVRSL